MEIYICTIVRDNDTSYFPCLRPNAVAGVFGCVSLIYVNKAEMEDIYGVTHIGENN